MAKYSGITEHNKAAFDAIVPRTKEAIESGEIPIPAGGTKLYKHEVSVTVSDADTIGSDIYSFVILDVKSTALTMNEIVSLKPICIGGGGSLATIVGVCYPVSQNSSYPYGVCSYNGTPLGQGVSVSDVSFEIADNITEL